MAVNINSSATKASSSGGGGAGMTPEQEARLVSVEALTTALGASTSPAAGKNKFNPSLAQNGRYIFFGGTIETAANGISYGLQNVVEGKSYTYWIPSGSIFSFDGTIRCYDTNGVFLGLHQFVSASYPVAPIPPTSVSFTGGNKVCKFTIPIGSKIGKIGLSGTFIAHTQADYEALIPTVQLEVGNAQTTFEPFNLGATRSIKEDSLPSVYAKKSDLNDITPKGVVSKNTATTVCVDAIYAYIRTKWNSTLDLVQQVQYGTTTSFNNNVVNPYSVKTIPATTLDENTITAYSTGTLIVNHVDDAAPCNYNLTYIGANHGAYIVHQATVAGHGKTVVDVGSRWTQGLNTFTIMRIVDANTLWLVSQNIGATYWQFVTSSQSGLTFTHLSGATNSTAFTPITSSLTQLYPAIKNQVKTIRLDGRVPVTTSGVYKCEFVDIVNTYEICNPVSVIAYVQSVVGSATQPPFDHTSVTTDMRVVLTYRYASNGSCSINSMYQTKSQLRMGYIGGTQALPLSYTGKSLYQYVPKLLPIVGTLKTWNLTAVEDITSQIETLNFTNAVWADSNNPPDRMVQFVSTGSVKNHGMVIGYGLQRGYGRPSIRKSTSQSNAGFLNASTRKMYPYLINDSSFASSLIPANTVINATVYRSIYNFDTVPSATVYTWYYDGNDIIVVFDTHQSSNAVQLPLPSWMDGLSATVIDSSLTFTLLTPIVSNDGLLASVTGGYGQATIRLSM